MNPRASAFVVSLRGWPEGSLKSRVYGVTNMFSAELEPHTQNLVPRRSIRRLCLTIELSDLLDSDTLEYCRLAQTLPGGTRVSTN